MTYEELNKIAQSHVRDGENLPSNSLLLLNQLHIPYKTEQQCELDFKGSLNPLYNNPAFLFVDTNGNKTIYFNSNTRYWNFYIFHEIAHYLLGHEQNSPQNELDADMLACILAAPMQNLPCNVKSARDISVMCQIPIDKADAYWAEIKPKPPVGIKRSLSTTLLLLVIFVFVFLFFTIKANTGEDLKIKQDVNITKQTNTTDINITEKKTTPQTTITNANQQAKTKVVSESKEKENPDDIPDSKENNSKNINQESEGMLFYITTFGTHYHTKNCQFVKYKTNTTTINQEQIQNLNLEACEKCILKN